MISRSLVASYGQLINDPLSTQVTISYTESVLTPTVSLSSAAIRIEIFPQGTLMEVYCPVLYASDFEYRLLCMNVHILYK